MTVVTAAPARRFRVFARIMALSSIFLNPLGIAAPAQAMLGPAKLSALLTLAKKMPYTSLNEPYYRDIAGIAVGRFRDCLTARGRSMTDGRRGDDRAASGIFGRSP